MDTQERLHTFDALFLETALLENTAIPCIQACRDTTLKTAQRTTAMLKSGLFSTSIIVHFQMRKGTKKSF